MDAKVDIDGTLWRRHVDQIVGTSENQPSRPTCTVTSGVPVNNDTPSVPSSRASDAGVNPRAQYPVLQSNVEIHRETQRNRTG